MTDSLSTEELHARLQQLTEVRLSSASRVGHLVMTLVAFVVAAALAYMLLFTDLRGPFPLSVSGMAFLWGMCAVAFAWGSFGLLLLFRRKPLLAVHEVVAAMIAMVFGLFLTGGALGFVMAREDAFGPTPHAHLTPAIVLGGGLSAFAFLLWVLSLLRYSRLQSMRARLEHELSGR
jgi:hypothetical protein